MSPKKAPRTEPPKEGPTPKTRFRQKTAAAPEPPAAVKAVPTDEFEHIVCKTCEQHYGCIDKDSSDGSVMAWKSYNFARDGTRRPYGGECTPCFCCRRKHEPPKTAQAAILEQIAKEAEEGCTAKKDLVAAQRSAYVRGDTKWTNRARRRRDSGGATERGLLRRLWRVLFFLYSSIFRSICGTWIFRRNP